MLEMWKEEEGGRRWRFKYGRWKKGDDVVDREDKLAFLTPGCVHQVTFTALLCWSESLFFWM